jgi:hypothetical protein
MLVGTGSGVPLVAREVEAGTAAMAWSLWPSRRRWLARQALPTFAFVLVVALWIGIAAWLLADTRSAGGTWSSMFADADLFGLPVVAGAVAATAIGVATGAIIGRILPALILSVLLVGACLAAIAATQPLIVHATLDQTNVGSAAAVATLLRDNPDFDIRLVTPDDEILSLEDARSRAPAGTDPDDWTAQTYRPVALGVKASKTGEWQVVESVLLLVVAGVAYIGAGEVVHRRSPR